jgi:hypothetical protein
MIPSLLRRRPSPALVISCIALLFALAGTSIAAVNALPRNSVGSLQLKNSAVTSVKVKDRSLLRKDFAAGQIPAGPAGPAGVPGPAGAAGARGPTGPAGPGSTANIRWALVKADATIVAQAGTPTITMTSHSAGNYILDFGGAINTKLILASSGFAGGDTSGRDEAVAGPCGGTNEGAICTSGNDTNHVQVKTYNATGVQADHPFYVAVIG